MVWIRDRYSALCIRKHFFGLLAQGFERFFLAFFIFFSLFLLDKATMTKLEMTTTSTKDISLIFLFFEAVFFDSSALVQCGISICNVL